VFGKRGAFRSWNDNETKERRPPHRPNSSLRTVPVDELTAAMFRFSLSTPPGFVAVLAALANSISRAA
jgi:hypothetical protein